MNATKPAPQQALEFDMNAYKNAQDSILLKEDYVQQMLKAPERKRYHYTGSSASAQPATKRLTFSN